MTACGANLSRCARPRSPACSPVSRRGSGSTSTRTRRTPLVFQHACKMNICQLGNAIVGAAEPPTELAVDILQHHHIRGDVGLVVGVEVSGRKLVQHGWALRDDGG